MKYYKLLGILIIIILLIYSYFSKKKVFSKKEKFQSQSPITHNCTSRGYNCNPNGNDNNCSFAMGPFTCHEKCNVCSYTNFLENHRHGGSAATSELCEYDSELSRFGISRNKSNNPECSPTFLKPNLGAPNCPPGYVNLYNQDQNVGRNLCQTALNEIKRPYLNHIVSPANNPEYEVDITNENDKPPGCYYQGGSGIAHIKYNTNLSQEPITQSNVHSICIKDTDSRASQIETSIPTTPAPTTPAPTTQNTSTNCNTHDPNPVPSIPNNYKKYNNVDLEGGSDIHEIRSYRAPSWNYNPPQLSECIDECNRFPGCNAFTKNYHGCFFKNITQTPEMQFSLQELINCPNNHPNFININGRNLYIKDSTTPPLSTTTALGSTTSSTVVQNPTTSSSITTSDSSQTGTGSLNQYLTCNSNQYTANYNQIIQAINDGTQVPNADCKDKCNDNQFLENYDDVVQALNNNQQVPDFNCVNISNCNDNQYVSRAAERINVNQMPPGVVDTNIGRYKSDVTCCKMLEIIYNVFCHVIRLI